MGDAAAQTIVGICARIDWNHVINGLDMRLYELEAHDQHGLAVAARRDIDAVQDLISVLQEWGQDHLAEQERGGRDDG